MVGCRLLFCVSCCCLVVLDVFSKVGCVELLMDSVMVGGGEFLMALDGSWLLLVVEIC